MTSVWVVHTGDYDERYLVLIANSFETAVSATKKEYPEHKYRVTWEDPEKPHPDSDYWDLVGKFERLPNHSILEKWFDIQEMEVKVS